MRPILAAAVVLLACATRAGASPITLTATINSAQDVPVHVSLASGTGTFVLNASQTALTYAITISGLDFTGSQTADLNDNLVAAHFHNAPAGANGPVVFGFFGAPFNDNNPNDVVITPFANGVGGTISGKWDLPEGNATTLAAQVSNLLAGDLYVNFHTVAFGGGDIRGQVVVQDSAVPEPATLTLFGTGLLLAVRRRLGRR